MPVKTLKKPIALEEYLTASKISVKKSDYRGVGFHIVEFRYNSKWGVPERRLGSSGIWYLDTEYDTHTPALVVKEINSLIKEGNVVKLYTPVKKW